MGAIIAKPGRAPIALAVSLLAACSPVGEGASPGEGKVIGSSAHELLSNNGLNSNGLNSNGLNVNGLNVNGLNLNGLSTAAFKSWFNANATTSEAVMSYLYACAAPAGSSLAWTNPTTGRSYLWTGVLGFAPGWAGGAQPTVAEQQLATACLSAHVNMYGVHVPIAVEGRSASGVQIPIQPSELTTYSWREACFFGNAFNGDGMYLAYDRSNWNSSQSSARGCAVDVNGKPVQCTPIVTTGDECRDICTADATGVFWESCTWKSKAYKPVTTRIRPADVYTCGDGICQFTEKCGTGLTPDNCRDCGPCP
jgi:hypothetical protein